MINPFKETNWKPGVTERRKFTKCLVIGFPSVAALLVVAEVRRELRVAPGGTTTARR